MISLRSHSMLMSLLVKFNSRLRLVLCRYCVAKNSHQFQIILIPNKKPVKINLQALSCRGRDRTSTRQLAIAQSSVVDPGRYFIAELAALCYVYSVILTPESRGHVCQKFHHPTIFKNF